MPRIKPIMRGFELDAAMAGFRIEPGTPIVPQIYHALRDRIVDNRLPPGAPIHESDIAALCAVSRTPVRSALQQLALEGLVETRPQVGSTVAQFDRGRVVEAVFIRRALECEIARRLARRGIDEKRLAPILDEQFRHAEADDAVAFFAVDEAFHAALADMAEVPAAWRLVQSVKPHVDRARLYLMGTIKGRCRAAHGEHLAILAAVRDGDTEAAAAAMRRHVETVFEALEPEGLTSA